MADHIIYKSDVVALSGLIADAYERHLQEHAENGDFEACDDPLCKLAAVAEGVANEHGKLLMIADAAQKLQNAQAEMERALDNFA